MISLTYILFLLCIRRVLSEDCVLDNGSRDLNEERKLNRDLLCNYDMFEPPNNTTMVRVRFRLKFFNFDSKEEIFTMYSWIFLYWTDKRLKWDPKDYDGISETQFKRYQLWTPKLKHQTNIVYDEFDQTLNTMCEVSSSGNVMCMLQVLSQTECSTNLTQWPYDTQTCSFKFGVYSNYKGKIVLTFNSTRGISMFGAEYGPGWNIIDFEKRENATSETQLYLAFVVERQAESLGCLTIFPSVVLSILTVTSLFLDFGRIRGGIEILSLLGHFYIQVFLSVSIPKHSSTAPSILHFIITSLAVTTASILFTVVLSYLLRKKDRPQQWIFIINGFVTKSPVKFLIWPRWEAKNLETASNEIKNAREVWNDFANIINSASIVIVIVIYITIFLCFMPKQKPFDL